jgi:hypothetical protein
MVNLKILSLILLTISTGYNDIIANKKTLKPHKIQPYSKESIYLFNKNLWEFRWFCWEYHQNNIQVNGSPSPMDPKASRTTNEKIIIFIIKNYLCWRLPQELKILMEKTSRWPSINNFIAIYMAYDGGKISWDAVEKSFDGIIFDGDDYQWWAHEIHKGYEMESGLGIGDAINMKNFIKNHNKNYNMVLEIIAHGMSFFAIEKMDNGYQIFIPEDGNGNTHGPVKGATIQEASIQLKILITNDLKKYKSKIFH